MTLRPAHRYAAPALLAAGAALSIASVSSTVWWTGTVETQRVRYDNRFSLWNRKSTRYTENPLGHGEMCRSSDECAEGLWCRSGPRKCWTDSDCRWSGTLRRGEDGSNNCKRMPRRDYRKSWDELCSTSAVLPCRSVGLIRTLVAVSALVALLSSPCALWMTRLPSWMAGVSTAFGGIAIPLALGIDLPYAHANGPGFVLHCVGFVLVTGGCSALWIARAVGPQEVTIDPKLATTYGKGRRFNQLDEEDDPNEPLSPGRRRAAVGATLLQTLHGAEPLSPSQRDIEKAVCSGEKTPGKEKQPPRDRPSGEEHESGSD